jgi:hypothetical protein
MILSVSLRRWTARVLGLTVAGAVPLAVGMPFGHLADRRDARQGVLQGNPRRSAVSPLVTIRTSMPESAHAVPRASDPASSRMARVAAGKATGVPARPALLCNSAGESGKSR